jgi:hypothetical protein
MKELHIRSQGKEEEEESLESRGVGFRLASAADEVAKRLE